mmetsp:Transcript_104509/g.300427  ORF Transcript_104509/g.300427 Transcript_104509/m.300427 type:complete len:427 (+) Transcript_104509:146-1426(+)
MAMLMQAQHELRRSGSKLGRGSTPRDYAPVSQKGDDDKDAGPHSDFQGLVNIFCGHKILTTMLLVALPAGFYAHHTEMDPQYIFLFNFVAIVPLAWLIGKATEDVAAKLGEAAGGLLNATFGNVVEMLLCVSGIRNGEIIVVQCTLLGSILSNLLLVMGCAFLAGGLIHHDQRYNQAGAATQCSLMSMSVFAIGLPTIYTNILKQDEEWEHMVAVSRWVSVMLLGVYFAYLVFQLKTHAHLFQDEDAEEEEDDEDIDLLITEEGWGLSSANWLIRRSDWSISFLEDAFRLCHEGMPLFGDQDAMIHLLLNDRALLSKRARTDRGPVVDRHAVIIPQHELNAYDALNAFYMEADAYTEGDLLITFPGCKEAGACNPLFRLAAAHAKGGAGADGREEQVSWPHVRVFGPPEAAAQLFETARLHQQQQH